MEIPDNDFETTLKEVLEDRQIGSTMYTHIECKIGGLDRVAMACRSLSDWIKNNPADTVTYLFVNKADYRTALKGSGLQPQLVSKKREAGKILMTTYDHWVAPARDIIKDRGSQIVLMDMGFGIRTAEMAVTTMEMISGMQELLQGNITDATVSWVSVSYTARALLSQRTNRRLSGLLMPRFRPTRLCHKDQAHEEIRSVQRQGGNWHKDAVGRFVRECLGDRPTKASSVALALVTSMQDAYHIRNELSVKCLCRVPIHFIQPTTDRRLIDNAVTAWDGVKIVCVDPRVSIIPPISNLKAVILAPEFDGYAFDLNTTCVVGKKVFLDTAAALAFSLRGEVSGKVVPVDVHVPQSIVSPERSANGDIDGLERQAELSPVSNVEFIYSNLYAVVEAGRYPYPGILSVMIPPSHPEIIEAQRRLSVWRITESAETGEDNQPGFRLRAPLGVAMQRFLEGETNMHSLVLLSSIRPEMSVSLKQVLVDLAVLVSEGPSTVLDPCSPVAEYNHLAILRGLRANTGFARNHCHKGLIWQSMAYLHAHRKLAADATWGEREDQGKALGGSVRCEVLDALARRVGLWKQYLRIPMADQASALPREEFRIVENILVAAFAFNLMMVHVDEVGHFGRDMTSEVILEQEADGESIDWDMLRMKAKEDKEEHMMAIYSHLHMDVIQDENDLPVYRAVGTTVVSISAFCDGLMDLGLEHYNALRPPFRPERRCLVPRGTSWASRPSGSSEDSSGSGDEHG